MVGPGEIMADPLKDLLADLPFLNDTTWQFVAAIMITLGLYVGLRFLIGKWLSLIHI